VIDDDVRLAVYERFVADGEPPGAERVAELLGRPAADVEAALRRLDDAHALVLEPGTLDVWMANPLCARPTPFRVRTARGEHWGTCVWDALGIPAMFGADATIATTCADCGEPMELRVRSGELEPVDGVAHFAVPARRWWEDIGFT
jgi:Alkylmercury lyase